MRIVESERETRRVVGDEVVVVVDVAGTDFSRVLGLGRLVLVRSEVEEERRGVVWERCGRGSERE